ncbi:MAG TPA: MBL fold metallo-hydrolase [Gemmatimonadales bacterium]
MPPRSRRRFIETSATCASHLAMVGMVARRRGWAWRQAGSVVASEAFGVLQRVAEGVWALVSTPFEGDRTTLANGGIIAGREAVLAIEGFYQPAGARWLAERAVELTGRRPTVVLLTHYHSDHVNGVAGYHDVPAHPAVRTTAVTRAAVLDRNTPPDAARDAALTDARLLPPDTSTTLDLGDRHVTVTPFAGHTDSDLIVELEDPNVVFCGDLYWNAIFPNYVDAKPAQLAASVAALKRARETQYVPGHGGVSGADGLASYVSVLEAVEDAARRAHGAGLTAEEARERFALPASLGAWTLFSPAFFPRAFNAWYRELGT